MHAPKDRDYSIPDVYLKNKKIQEDTAAIQSAAEEAVAKNFGRAGAKSITGTDPVTPDAGKQFYLVIALAEAVVAAQGDVAGAGNADLTGFTAIPVGIPLPGQWNSITLTSGEMIAFQEEV